MYPIYLYPILAFFMPVVLRLINRRLTWISIPITVIIELIIYMDEFGYYESRPLMIILTLIQIILMAILIIILSLIGNKK